MKHIIWLALPILLICQSFCINSSSLSVFFTDADNFFATYVAYNKIKYKEVKDNPRLLNKLVNQIAKADLTNLSADEQKAFYINSYNILVIKGIIDNYPLKRPTDIEGFFDKTTYKIAKKEYTLDHLEFNVIFPEFKDPRLHFVLVCAAISCPPIVDYAYHPEKLEEQLNERTRASINNAVFVIYDEEAMSANISEIFKWYKDQFQPNIKAFINAHRNDPLPEDISIDYYPYNWSLNDASPFSR